MISASVWYVRGDQRVEGMLVAGHSLADEFERLGTWTTKFTIEGQEYGGSYDAINDVRVKQFFAAFPNAHTILELGSFEGGHSVALAHHPGVRRVVAIEARPVNLEKARFIQRVFATENIQFVEANLETIDLTQFGRFDAVFCCGLLYHLPKPWGLLDQIAHVTDNLFLSTHYAQERQADTTLHELHGRMYREYGFGDPLSGMSQESFWPTREDLFAMLRRAGFGSIGVVADDPAFIAGPLITLWCKAGRSHSGRIGRLRSAAWRLRRLADRTVPK